MVVSNAVVTLREITQENLDDILNLQVTKEQENFVASNAVSIAQAHFYPELAWFRAIYADDTPVGFVMLADESANSSYTYIWRLMIDSSFQKLGFGRRAVELILQHVKTRPQAKYLLTSCPPGEESPRGFYEKMGFVYTGEVDEDGELIMKYEF
ncbi:MAG: GNAT family N-acetyltransferase [Waterburya sp.]